MANDRRQELVTDLLHAVHVLGAAGFLPATDGNASVRLNERHILITARGVEKRTLNPADLIEATLDDVPPTGGSTEWPMHRELYRQRKDVHCVLHVHSPALTAFAAAHRIPHTELLAEAYATLGSIVLVPFATPGTTSAGEALLRTSCTAGVYLLANHGAVAVGGSVRETLHRIERAEFLARVELKAELLGGGHLLTADQLSGLR